MKSISIDTRLIANSGIGTYIRNLIPLVIDRFPLIEFNLLIDEKLLNYYPSCFFLNKNINLIYCNSSLYSIYEQVEVYRKIPRNTGLFWSPHYVIPVLYSGKLLVTIHDVCHLSQPSLFPGIQKRLYSNLMFRAVISRSTKIITVSKFSQQEISKHLYVKSDQVEVIYNGVANELSNECLAQLKLPMTTPYIMFLGNVKPNKNLLRLLFAFDKLVPLIPHKLLIVGKKDGFIVEDPEVSKYSLKLGDRVEFSGFVDDLKLKSLLYNASALIFPSVYEGFGLPPLEAMSCSCPVAASSAASIPEICGDSAIYFDPYNPDDIANKIYQLVTNSELSKELINKGLQRVKTFSWSTCAEKTCNVIEDLLIKSYVNLIP